MREHFTRFRHMPGEHKGKTAKRIDILIDLAKSRIDRLGDLGEFGARVSFPTAAFYLDKQIGRFLVMLILNFANDFLDQIFNCHQPLSARIFINHNSEMDTLLTHKT